VKEKYVKRKQKGSLSWLLPVAQHIYIHVYFVHRTVYMYTITAVHLDFLRALQVCRPDTRAHIRVLHMQCVCVCVHTHTTHTHRPPVKNGKTLTSPNESLTPQKNANRRAVDQLGKTRSLLFYKRMQSSSECWKHLWIAPKTPVEHTYAKRWWPPQKWIKMMTETTSTTTMARRKPMHM